MIKKKIAILGSTGSIGRSSLEVLKDNIKYIADQFNRLSSLVEKSNYKIVGINLRKESKRIRKLIRQRKERDEQIQQLIHQNEELNHRLIGREKEFTQAQEITTETSEKQLEDS